ncbi:hypothetical protein POMI540_1894 [Schizosaccharomyces pombe]
MGTAVGVTWGIITKLFATAANRNHGDGSPILATSLALASFISAYIRSRYGYRFFCIIWIFIDCFLLTRDPFEKTIAKSFYISLVYPSLIAAGVVSLVTILVPPMRMASDLVGQSGLDHLNKIMQSLNFSVENFFPSDESVSFSSSSSVIKRMFKEHESVLRNSMDDFHTAISSSEIELNYSNVSVSILKLLEPKFERITLAMSAQLAASFTLYETYNFSIYKNQDKEVEGDIRVSELRFSLPESTEVQQKRNIFTPQYQLHINGSLRAKVRPKDSKDRIVNLSNLYFSNVDHMSSLILGSLKLAHAIMKWLVSDVEHIPDERLRECIESLQEIDSKEENLMTEIFCTAFKETKKVNDFGGFEEIEDEEEVLVIAYYLFNLFEVAREVKNLLLLLEGLKAQRHNKPKLFFRKFNLSLFDKQKYANYAISALLTHFTAGDADKCDDEAPDDASGEEDDSPKVLNDQSFFDSVRYPLKFFLRKMRRKCWRVYHFTARSKDVRYGLKMAIGIGLLSIVAFQKSTAARYTLWNGQWSLISTLFVLEVTVSTTLRVGLFRTLGTLSGAVYAYAAWEVSQGWSYAIATLTFAISWVSCYVKYNTEYSGIATVFNITFPPILYGSYLKTSTISPFHLACIRFIVVNVGIGMAIVVNIVVFPYLARRVLKYKLGQASLLSLKQYTTLSDYLLSRNLYTNLTICEGYKKQISSLLVTARKLLQLVNMEFNLKGPFPVGIYNDLIIKLENLGIRLVVLNRVRSRFGLYLYYDVVKNMIDYRKDLIVSMTLTFYILYNSIMSKAPIPYFVPSCRQALWNLRLAIEEEGKRRFVTNGGILAQGAGSDGVAKDVPENHSWLPAQKNFFLYYVECQVIGDIVTDLEYSISLVRRINGEKENETIGKKMA